MSKVSCAAVQSLPRPLRFKYLNLQRFSCTPPLMCSCYGEAAHPDDAAFADAHGPAGSVASGNFLLVEQPFQFLLRAAVRWLEPVSGQPVADGQLRADQIEVEQGPRLRLLSKR